MPIDAVPLEWKSGSIGVSESRASEFLFLLARMGTLGAIAGFPGFRNAPAAPRVAFALGLAMAAWPAVAAASHRTRPTLWGIAAEILLGLTAGAVLNWLQESLSLGLQLAGGQAGFSYALTIDPASQADASVLPVAAQLMAGLLLFSTGLDREVIRAAAASYAAYPAGGFWLDGRHLAAVAAWTAGSLTLALRIALPMLALLMMTDIVLALLSRIQAQLQLLSLAFPVKMLGALVLVAWLTPAMAALYSGRAAAAADLIRACFGRAAGN